MVVDKIVTCSFPREVHLLSSEPTHQELERIRELRNLLVARLDLFAEFEYWATTHILHKFLIARNYDLKKSFDLVVEAIKWRHIRNPDKIQQQPWWNEKMRREAETGKIYCNGLDKWGRPVVVFDNTVQNTQSIDDQITFLSWNLEFAIRQMPQHADKYLIFMHLGNFSFFNCPPFKCTMETIHMLCNCFPERLGHCIAYQAPGIFHTVFTSLKPFIDPKTSSKVVFVSGDVSSGSENDRLMCELIGEDWRSLTGATLPLLHPKNSPGYHVDSYWPTVISRVETMRAKDLQNSDGSRVLHDERQCDPSSSSPSDRLTAADEEDDNKDDHNRSERILVEKSCGAILENQDHMCTQQNTCAADMDMWPESAVNVNEKIVPNLSTSAFLDDKFYVANYSYHKYSSCIFFFLGLFIVLQLLYKNISNELFAFVGGFMIMLAVYF